MPDNKKCAYANMEDPDLWLRPDKTSMACLFPSNVLAFAFSLK
jgi:hypothetical protein